MESLQFITDADNCNILKLSVFGYRVLNFEVTDGSAGPVYVFERSTMTNGGQDPRVEGSVEKASSQFESTTVGKFDFGGDER